MHCMIVCNGDAGNETTDFRSNYSDVATDVSVISALREAANSPPVITNSGQRDRADQTRSQKGQRLSRGQATKVSDSCASNTIHIRLQAAAKRPLRPRAQDAV